MTKKRLSVVSCSDPESLKPQRIVRSNEFTIAKWLKLLEEDERSPAGRSVLPRATAGDSVQLAHWNSVHLRILFISESSSLLSESFQILEIQIHSPSAKTWRGSPVPVQPDEPRGGVWWSSLDVTAQILTQMKRIAGTKPLYITNNFDTVNCLKTLFFV